MRVCPHTVNQNRGRNVPCEKERKTGKDPQPGAVLHGAEACWQHVQRLLDARALVSVWRVCAVRFIWPISASRCSRGKCASNSLPLAVQ